jgi:hypothetical protein
MHFLTLHGPFTDRFTAQERSPTTLCVRGFGC